MSLAGLRGQKEGQWPRADGQGGGRKEVRMEEPPGPGGLRRLLSSRAKGSLAGNVLASLEDAFKHWRQMCGILGDLK